MSVAFDRMLLGVEVLTSLPSILEKILCLLDFPLLLYFQDPYTFNPYHKAVRQPFDYYHFVHMYISPLIDFKYAAYLFLFV